MKRLVQAGLARLGAREGRLLRAAVGDPPRNDRGVELDLATHALLTAMRVAGFKPINELSVAKARLHYQRDGALLDLPMSPRVGRRDLEIPGAAGPLPARVYRPPTPAATRPLLLWLHGGGFVIGGLETHAAACARLALRSGCTLVAVDYRKSPEHKFPAASDDALAAFCWLRAHAEELGGERDHVAVGGDSAGATLSAGLCHRLRDAGDAQPLAQILVYPMTQFRAPFPSRHHFSEGMLLSAELIEWFRGHYLQSPEQGLEPLVSPLLSPRFDGLAPAVIHTAGFDPLRDEGEAYAQALRAAEVPVRLRCHERLIHGYLTMGGASTSNRQAIDDLADEITVALGASDLA